MVRRLALPLLALTSACIHLFNKVEARRLDPQQPVTVTSPVKAHLLDGRTVIFPNGVAVSDGAVRGDGYRYGLTLRDSTAVLLVPLDSVVGMEVFEESQDGVKSFLVSAVATAATLVATAGLAVAIFGSCPTIYTDSAGSVQLEAEAFSYSIAPIFESRDVDRLRVRSAPDGSVRLEVRNEALETHYVNQLELLEVSHDSSESAFVDELNRLVVVADQRLLARASDRRGHDVSGALRAEDGDLYRTDARTLNAAALGDLDDWINLVAAPPPDVDSVVVVLRLRNSLLNTTLLYDVMLGEPGARSLDWVGQDLKQVGPALEVAQWYQQRMGMDVVVAAGSGENSSYQVVAHVKDTGPIAWKDVAVVIPVLTRDSVRIRLRFPADNWRIDRAVLAGRYRRVTAQVVPLVEVETPHFSQDAALASLRTADSRYVQTSPGERLTAVFRPSSPPAGRAATRTFFVASQGYYIEWMRPGWLRAPLADRVFVPSDSGLARAMTRWRGAQDSLETLFAATRIPVR